jgi:hypothetical protein
MTDIDLNKITTVGELKKILNSMDDNDIIVIETTDLETGNAKDLYPFYVDVIEGLINSDGNELRELRLCQLNNI